MPAGPLPAPRATLANLPENPTSSFKLPGRQDLLPMVPYPSLSQPLLEQLDFERECKEVDAYAKRLIRNRMKKIILIKKRHCFQIFLLTYFS
jgi:hypothetical protein